MNEPMTFLDFFSGVGGFRKGFELCGMVCKGHCEIDKFADRSYRAIHDVKEDEWYGEDITKTKPADLPRVNLWAGGFPCQDISVSGRQRGLAGKRSSLFFEIVRLLKGTPADDRPEWLVLENVKNLLSVNRGWDFATVLHSLAEIGYHIEYGLLNSRFHGVPQNRERIYLVAYRHFRAEGGRKVFPVTAGDGKTLIQLIGGTQGKRVYDPTGIDTTRANLTYDELEMSGSRAVWPEVLAVYAVKTTTDPDDPQEVATVDDAKKAILNDIFWQMNEISSRTESKTEKVITETDDGHGNIVETATTVTRTYLYITVSHKTAEEMADLFNFNADQRQQLSELLAEENRSMWSAVLYGIYSGDDAIVTVALSQIGNVGGQPYWSWYGFDSRVEWCACFVSWCANECGYIDSGVIPKFAGCVNGVQWFKDRNQWQDGSFEPSAGQIIFFDWDNKGSSGPQDGQSDHVGIVEKCENGIVYTIEGNSGDSCRQKQYPVGHYEILGYGIPAF